ncbi:MAG TPA: hypothetical protein VFZ37_14590 [Jiangellaceae bacterium]
MPLPPAGDDGSLIRMEHDRILRSDGRRASLPAPGHRPRRAAMLRRQLVADAVTAMLFVLGLVAGWPILALLVLLITAVPATAVFVIRAG